VNRLSRCRYQATQAVEAVRDEAERGKHARSLLRRRGMDQGGQFRILDPPINLFRTRHPGHQLFRRRQIEQQMRKDLLWTFVEELAFFVIGWLDERRRKRPGLRTPDELFGRSPVRAAAVERIQDDIAS
jgi:hypothetical protein